MSVLTIGIGIDSGAAVSAVDDVRASMKALKADFEAAEKRAQEFNATVTGMKRAAFDEMSDGLRRVADEAKGATSEVQRLQRALTGGQPKMITDARAQAAALIADLRAVALAANVADAAIARVADTMSRAVREGGKLQAAQSRPSQLSGSSPAQLRIAGPSQVIDVTPINAASSAFARLQAIGQSALASIASYARGAQTGLSSLASTAGQATVSAFNAMSSMARGAFSAIGSAASSVASGGLAALRYAALGTLGVIGIGAAATIAPIAAIAYGAHRAAQAFGGWGSVMSGVTGFLGSLMSGISRAITGISTLSLGIVGMGGLSFAALAKSAVETADAFTLFERKTDSLAGGVTSKANDIRAAILGVAADTRTSIESASSEFNKLSIVLSSTGASTDDIRALATGVNAAMKLSGASAVEAERAFTQFSQGVSKGKLELQDLKSIAQSAPGLMDLMRQATGKTMGQLNESMKKSGAEAQRVMTQIASYVANQAPILAQRLALMPRTMGEAMTELKNTWFLAVGQMQKNSDFMSPIISSIDRVKAMLAGPTFQAAFGNILSSATQVAEEIIKWLLTGESFGLSMLRAGDHIKNTHRYVGAMLSDLVAMANAKMPWSDGKWESEITKLRAKINGERDALTKSDLNNPFTGGITGDAGAVKLARARDELDALKKSMMDMPEAKLRLHFDSAEAATQKAALVGAAESAARDASVALQRAADANGTGIESAWIKPLNRVTEAYGVLREQFSRNDVSPAALTGFTSTVEELKSSLTATQTKVEEFRKAKDDALASGNTTGALIFATVMKMYEDAAAGIVPTLEKALALKQALEGSGVLAVKAAATAGNRTIKTTQPAEKSGGSGRDIGKSMVERLNALKAENQLIAAQLTGNQELIAKERIRLEIEKALTVEMRAKKPELAAQIESEIRLKEQMQERLRVFQEWKSVGEQASQTLFDNFVRVGEGAMSFKDALKQSLVQLVKLVAQAAILKPLMNSIGNGFGAGGASIFGGGGAGSMGGIFSMLGFANDGAFNQGVQMFAQGGVVSSATAFGYGGGKLGIMGEAGPEAIMPLSRGPGGKLGVKAHGGSSANSVTFAPVFHVAGDLNDETRGRLMNDMQAMLAQATPGLTKRAVAAVRRENVDSPQYMKR